ncbi:MAG TPA: hypothetical protein VEO54_17240 [Thermoanaerobaculia bacterium]|nr:hypothetical protein [Thermoanaerobaculia bacterium]
MSAALDYSSSALRTTLEEEVLEYLREKQRDAASAIIEAVLKQHQFLTSAPVVAAIWSLNEQRRISIGSDWTVSLREAQPATRR